MKPFLYVALDTTDPAHPLLLTTQPVVVLAKDENDARVRAARACAVPDGHDLDIIVRPF